ncbi:MAG: hypothetical protein J6Q65_05800 [Lentisphaeria bacterium]|nr:hypothetical protein [Lentisphaeria bacterium]
MSEEKKEKRGFKYWFRQIKKFPSWIFFLPAKILDLLSVIMRHEIIDPNKHLDEYDKPDGHQVIGLVWHNRLLFYPSMCPQEGTAKNGRSDQCIPGRSVYCRSGCPVRNQKCAWQFLPQCSKSAA